MKFRTARNTFNREELVEKLDLKPLNDMPDLPLYGTEPRVRCKNLRGPWQEIELRVHSYEEIDRPEFWEFVDRAVAGFGKFTEKVQAEVRHPAALEATRPQVALRPQRVSRSARRSCGTSKVLEELFELLVETAPDGPVPLEQQAGGADLRAASSKSPGRPCRPRSSTRCTCTSSGPKGRFTLGQITDLGHEPEVDGQRPESRRAAPEVPHGRGPGRATCGSS